MRDDDYLYVLMEEPPEEMRPLIEQAVAALPEAGDRDRRLTAAAALTENRFYSAIDDGTGQPTGSARRWSAPPSRGRTR